MSDDATRIRSLEKRVAVLQELIALLIASVDVSNPGTKRVFLKFIAEVRKDMVSDGDEHGVGATLDVIEERIRYYG